MCQRSSALLRWRHSAADVHKTWWRRRCVSRTRTMRLRCSDLVFQSSSSVKPSQDWTDMVWVPSQYGASCESDISVHVGHTVIEPSDRVRDLGVILDSSMSMRQHIAKVTSTCFFHLRRLRKIGKVLDQDNRSRLVCAFILTGIDYCNSVCWTTGLCARAVATCPSCWCSICRGPSTTRPCNGDNDEVTLATSSSAHHL